MSAYKCKNCGKNFSTIKNAYLKNNYCSFRCMFEHRLIINTIIGVVTILLGILSNIVLPNFYIQYKSSTIQLHILLYLLGILMLSVSVFITLTKGRNKNTSNELKENKNEAILNDLLDER